MVTLLCTAKHPEYLAVGFCKSDALITDPSQLKGVRIEDRGDRILAEVETRHDPLEGRTIQRSITSGCGKGTNFDRNVATVSRRRIDAPLRVSPSRAGDGHQRRRLLPGLSAGRLGPGASGARVLAPP